MISIYTFYILLPLNQTQSAVLPVIELTLVMPFLG